jgi:hypothetical protein
MPYSLALVGQVSAPAITVERTGGAVIPNGGMVTRITTLNTPLNLSFTIRNPGNANLTGLAITKAGAHPGEFTITANPASPVGNQGSTVFTVRVNAGSVAARSTLLHIASNAWGSNPYDLNIAVQVLSDTVDSDGDGVSDGAEFSMAALGFDWQLGQPALAGAFRSAAGKAGLSSIAQLPALRTVPSFTRSPVSGATRLTIGVQKGSDSANFFDFPMNGPGGTTVINGQGKLEFEFTEPGNVEFFRLLPE